MKISFMKRRRPFVDNLQFNVIDQVERDFLVQAFEEVEILEAINSLGGDKAPRPDGMTIAFFKKCWVVIKEDLLKVFGEFFENAKLEKCLNAIFIALIP